LTLRVFAPVVAYVAAVCTLASRSVAQPAENADPYKTVVVTAPSPYWGYTYSPYGDLVRAEGDFLIKREQAGLLREQVRQEKLKTERMRLEHWEWKRDFLAGAANRERERVRKAEVERGRSFPPITEILAAIPLNNLLDELMKRPVLLTEGSTAVEAEWLAHVNITVDGRGNSGLLKEERIFWPELLLQPDFDIERKKIDQFLDLAKKEVLISSTLFQTHAQQLAALRQCVHASEQRVRSWSKRDDSAWNPRHCVEAKRFLRQVSDAFVILEKPDPAYYFGPLHGKTVSELVAYMKKRGVRFAPATAGCEPYYVALHRALADEVTRLLDKQPTLKNP